MLCYVMYRGGSCRAAAPVSCARITYASTRELQAVPTYWNMLGGTLATVSAFSAETRMLYLMAGRQNDAGVNMMELAAVDVDAAAVVAHPALAPTGMPN